MDSLPPNAVMGVYSPPDSADNEYLGFVPMRAMSLCP